MRIMPKNKKRLIYTIGIPLALASYIVTTIIYSNIQFIKRNTQARILSTKSNLQYLSELLEKYHRKYEQYPLSLDKMVEKLNEFGSGYDTKLWGDRLKEDPFTNYKDLIYVPKFDKGSKIVGYTLYGIGPNKIDNGGKLDDIVSEK